MIDVNILGNLQGYVLNTKRKKQKGMYFKWRTQEGDNASLLLARNWGRRREIKLNSYWLKGLLLTFHSEHLIS